MESEHLSRVRRICLTLPGSSEKLSHGELAFFVQKRCYAMLANNHHNDGHVGVWIAAEPGAQAALIRNDPKTYYRPPYVGVRGWVGIELMEIGDDELASHLTDSWKFIAGKAKRKRQH